MDMPFRSYLGGVLDIRGSWDGSLADLALDFLELFANALQEVLEVVLLGASQEPL